MLFFKLVAYVVSLLISYYLLRLLYGLLFDREELPWPFNSGDR